MIATIDESKFSEIAKNVAYPCVIRGFASHWSAVRDWTVEYLTEKAGSAEVNLEVSGRRDFEYRVSELRRVKLSDLTSSSFSASRTGKSVYSRFSSLPFALEKDVELGSRFGLTPDWRGKMLSVAPEEASVGTHLHFDSEPNIHVVISGAKRWQLWDPCYTSKLYKWPSWNVFRHHRSRVDVRNPDPILFPEFLAVREHRLTVDLHAGDAIFVPPFWWHHVESMGSSISVNQFFLPRRHDMSTHWGKYCIVGIAYAIRELIVFVRRLSARVMETSR